MPDRLAELVRQRALVLEQLAWFDREIASANTLGATAATGPQTPPLANVPDPAPDLASAALPVQPTAAASGSAAANDLAAGVASTAKLPLTATSGAAAREADLILDRYRVANATVKQDVRKGCLLYFAGAFVALGIVVAILYLTIGSR